MKVVLKKGQKVYWNDPDSASSGQYEVLIDIEEEDTIILIGNGYSEAEVYLDELHII